jgi:hypothetical protein
MCLPTAQILFFYHYNHHIQTSKKYKDHHNHSSYIHFITIITTTSQISPSFSNNLINNMQTQAIMGRGGYNRISSPALGRGGYNRDVKTSGISRPSNPSSLTVRSARAADDGRGGYN